MRIIGLDLGQEHDPAAAAVLDRADGLPTLKEPDAGERSLRCLSLKRWELKTDYTEIVETVTDERWDFLVPDFCGVGRPVVEMLWAAARRKKHPGVIRPVVTIGSQASQVSHTRYDKRVTYHTVPKIELVTSIMIVQQRRLLVLPALPETAVLLHELDGYRMKYSRAGNQQFGNDPRRAPNDDLVSALGLAVWGFLNFSRRLPALFLPGQAPDENCEAGPGVTITPANVRGGT